MLDTSIISFSNNIFHTHFPINCLNPSWLRKALVYQFEGLSYKLKMRTFHVSKKSTLTPLAPWSKPVAFPDGTDQIQTAQGVQSDLRPLSSTC